MYYLRYYREYEGAGTDSIFGIFFGTGVVLTIALLCCFLPTRGEFKGGYPVGNAIIAGVTVALVTFIFGMSLYACLKLHYQHQRMLVQTEESRALMEGQQKIELRKLDLEAAKVRLEAAKSGKSVKDVVEGIADKVSIKPTTRAR